MKASLDDETDFRTFCLRVEPEAYDAYPPIPSLIIDSRPTRTNPDTLAVATALAFRPFMSTLTPTGEITPGCANAISRYMDAPSFLIQPVTLTATPFLDTGSKELVVSAPSLGIAKPSRLELGQLHLEINDRTEAYGFSGAGSEFRVAANIHSLANYTRTERDRYALLLSCAVVLAPSMGCRGVAMDFESDDDLTELLSAIGLAYRALHSQKP